MQIVYSETMVITSDYSLVLKEDVSVFVESCEHTYVSRAICLFPLCQRMYISQLENTKIKIYPNEYFLYRICDKCEISFD